MRIVYICKDCHTKDARVTKCGIKFTHHSSCIRSTCDICGKVAIVAQCWAYESLIKCEQFNIESSNCEKKENSREEIECSQ